MYTTVNTSLMVLRNKPTPLQLAGQDSAT